MIGHFQEDLICIHQWTGQTASSQTNYTFNLQNLVM